MTKRLSKTRLKFRDHMRDPVTGNANRFQSRAIALFCSNRDYYLVAKPILATNPLAARLLQAAKVQSIMG